MTINLTLCHFSKKAPIIIQLDADPNYNNIAVVSPAVVNKNDPVSLQSSLIVASQV